MLGQLGDGGRLEQQHWAHRRIKFRLQFCGDLQGGQGCSTHIKEIIVDADLLDSQDGPVNLRNPLLGLVGNLDIGVGELGTLVQGEQRIGLGLRRFPLRAQELAAYPLLHACLQHAGRMHQARLSRCHGANQRLDALGRCHGKLGDCTLMRCAAKCALRLRSYFPGIPVNAEPARAAGFALLFDENIHVLVRRCIRRKADAAEYGRQRGKQHIKIRCVISQQALKRACAGNFGPEM